MRLRGLIQGIVGTSYQGIVLIRLVLSDTLFSGFKETLLASLMATMHLLKHYLDRYHICFVIEAELRISGG
ncbi:hypothetical protein P8452_25790 [Trifolium repens]|nr:hypothetical protein P8452_25790 [Trifolium repens]